MKNKGHPNNKFQKYKKIDISHKVHQNNHKSGQFPIGTIVFQASQQIKVADDILLSVNTIKHFLGNISEN